MFSQTSHYDLWHLIPCRVFKSFGAPIPFLEFAMPLGWHIRKCWEIFIELHSWLKSTTILEVVALNYNKDTHFLYWWWGIATAKLPDADKTIKKTPGFVTTHFSSNSLVSQSLIRHAKIGVQFCASLSKTTCELQAHNWQVPVQLLCHIWFLC